MEIILLNFGWGHLKNKVKACVFPSGILVFLSGCAPRAALALQLPVLGPPGAALCALRAGLGRGAEHLLKAASAVVRPAYFRLKRADTQKRS